MADTKLISPGIPNYTLKRNLRLNDKYISNDGGDEGISITDDGDVKISDAAGGVIFNFNTVTPALRIADDVDTPDDYFEIAVNAGGDTTISTVDDSGNGNADLGISIQGGLTLNQASNTVQFQNDGVDRGSFYYGTADTFQIASATNDLLRLRAGGTGGVEIGTTGSGDITLDSAGDITLDAAGDNIKMLGSGGSGLDFIQSGTGDYTIKNLTSDKDIIFNVNDNTSDTEVMRLDGSESSLLIASSKKIEFGNVGEYIYGNGTNMFISSSGTLINQSYGTNTIKNVNNGSIILDAIGGVVEFRVASDSDDLCTLTVAANGVTTIATADSDGAVGHLNIEADGHVEFDGCAVGFDKETTTFAAAAVTSEGDDSTDIDFRLGNKHELGLTDNIGGSGENINMIFPATSGNFILVIYQDGTGSRTVAADAWRAYQSDGSTEGVNTLAANLTDGDVRWAGGAAPTLSTGANNVDVISIYWDADHGTALAVASLRFATPS